jgi:lipopolysaccharide export LptBFGC system permease protein LptF
LPFATFALGLFALSLIHRGRATRIVSGIAGCVAYFYLMRDGVASLVWTSRFPPILVAWLPNLIFVALALSVMAMNVTVRRFVEARSA